MLWFLHHLERSKRQKTLSVVVQESHNSLWELLMFPEWVRKLQTEEEVQERQQGMTIGFLEERIFLLEAQQEGARTGEHGWVWPK